MIYTDGFPQRSSAVGDATAAADRSFFCSILPLYVVEDFLFFFNNSIVGRSSGFGCGLPTNP